DLLIDDFSFMEDTLGNIKIISDNETADLYKAQVKISGRGNDISVNGFYNAKQVEQALNFDVALATVNLSTIEAFTFGQVKEMKGIMRGDLKVTGSVASPDVTGQLNFTN